MTVLLPMPPCMPRPPHSPRPHLATCPLASLRSSDSVCVPSLSLRGYASGVQLHVGVEILNHCIMTPKTGRDSNTAGSKHAEVL